MKKFVFMIVIYVTLISSAIADRYGIDEASADSGPLPSWALPLAFIALLIYHLKSTSDMQGEVASAVHRNDSDIKLLKDDKKRLNDEIVKFKNELIEARQEKNNVADNYSKICETLEDYLDGIITQDVFIAIAEKHIAHWKSAQ